MSRVKGGNVEPELLKIKQNVEPCLTLLNPAYPWIYLGISEA